MAQETLDYKFAYENDVSFNLKKRESGGNWITVVQVDENTHIADLWVYIKGICLKDFEISVDTIGSAMKQ